MVEAKSKIDTFCSAVEKFFSTSSTLNGGENRFAIDLGLVKEIAASYSRDRRIKVYLPNYEYDCGPSRRGKETGINIVQLKLHMRRTRQTYHFTVDDSDTDDFLNRYLKLARRLQLTKPELLEAIRKKRKNEIDCYLKRFR